MDSDAPQPGQLKPEDEAASEVASGNKPTMLVKVYAPFKVYFEGQAASVSAANAVGPFDVLPGHRNFLCMLVPCDIKVLKADGSAQTVKISRALMHVKSNSVIVFMDV